MQVQTRPCRSKFGVRALAAACLLSLPNACKNQPAIENISEPPPVTEADQEYANVFKPLDGRWAGTFRVFVDTRGQVPGPAQPHAFGRATLDSLPLALQTTIHVEQQYVSVTPYFQRVIIQDTYTNSAGQNRVVTSHGANKVQEGQLWCVVKKPDKTVVLRGHLEAGHTIVWQRSVENPFTIEYFRETVKGERYTIVGWGYYGDDDPQLSPRLWFRGEYLRQE